MFHLISAVAFIALSYWLMRVQARLKFMKAFSNGETKVMLPAEMMKLYTAIFDIPYESRAAIPPAVVDLAVLRKYHGRILGVKNPALPGLSFTFILKSDANLDISETKYDLIKLFQGKIPIEIEMRDFRIRETS
jgi:hypothetical protein